MAEENGPSELFVSLGLTLIQTAQLGASKARK